MTKKTEYFTAPYRMDYEYIDGPGALYILLHGYGQTGESFYKSIASIMPQGSKILIANGPFPLPGRARTAEALGHAWYFYDAKSDEYYVSYDIAVQLLVQLLQKLNLMDVQKNILGYSQGGYLAPFLAQELTNLKLVVSINSSFRVDKMKQGKEDFLVHAINGADDDIVDPIQARQKHETLDDLKRRGDFHLLPDTHHRITKDVLAVLKNYLT
tara:strand:- start:247 stop:885 length:639 start_codon:yes stop_codon:yes gene_type:complete